MRIDCLRKVLKIVIKSNSVLEHFYENLFPNYDEIMLTGYSSELDRYYYFIIMKTFENKILWALAYFMKLI